MSHEQTNQIFISNDQFDRELCLDKDGFTSAETGEKSRALMIEADGAATQVWQHKQGNALSEYQDSHVQEQISPTTHAIYKLFGAYIGANLHGPDEKAAPNILDVGGGIGRRRPLYMRRLSENVNYFGMDAFDINPDRDYPFICARLETLGQVEAFHNTFDAFIFGTSLDHFENLDEVADAVCKLGARDAIVVFWIGLHDASHVAADEGALAFRKIFDGAGLLTVVQRFLRFALWRFPRMAYVLQRRQAKLNRGESLDDLHFWYFTEKDLPRVLGRFGEITDISMLPGTNSVFATCRVNAGDPA